MTFITDAFLLCYQNIVIARIANQTGAAYWSLHTVVTLNEVERVNQLPPDQRKAQVLQLAHRLVNLDDEYLQMAYLLTPGLDGMTDAGLECQQTDY